VEFRTLDPPSSGTRIGMDDDRLVVPDDPIVPYIEGDGVGPDIWAAARPVLDAAVEKAFGGRKQLHWFEVLAGRKAQERCGEWLPEETVQAIRHFRVGMKGPLETPIGGGHRSLNVSLRRLLDLYASVRPIHWFEGVPSPVKHPEKLDVVLFRENTEDLHAGIEWKAGSDEATTLIRYLNENNSTNIRESSGIGVKPISANASKRLVRRAIQYALDRGRASVTLVHEGNIMKFTEGAFRDWGLELAAEEFAADTVTEKELWDSHDGVRPDNKIVIKDRIAAAMFSEVLLSPGEYSVIATTNLNGDYLGDALLAQVGSLGLGPSASIGDDTALFETTHDILEKHAGEDRVNPGSLILSGAMMLEHLGWPEAARLVTNALQATLKQKKVTYELERRMSDATLLKCSEFGKAISENLGAED
jgi:isocitrate dehydrogenase